MSSFCTAKATHIFFSKKFQHICVSLDVNLNESLTNDVVSFEQVGPDLVLKTLNALAQYERNVRKPEHSDRYLFFFFMLRFYGPVNPKSNAERD